MSRAVTARASRPRRPARKPPWDKHLRALISISSSSFYWEQDANYRFTYVSGSVFRKAGIDTRRFIGKTRWELGWAPLEGDWEAHKALLDARRPFSDFMFRFTTPQGEVRFGSTSGQPRFDRRGRFLGYCGISRDITRRLHMERRLLLDREVARTLTEADGAEEAAQRVLDTFCRTLDWACGLYWELDADGEQLRCTHVSRVTADGVEAFLASSRRVSPLAVEGKGLVRRACVAQEPVWIADVTRDRSYRRAGEARRAGLRGALAVPVKAGTRVIGVMEFYSRDAHQPATELLQSVAYIGASVGQFFQRKRAEEELWRFRAAMDLSGDAIYLVDRATMRFVDVNETACRSAGRTREQMLAMGPQDLLLVERAELERLYDEAIARSPASMRGESQARAKDGRRVVVELQRRALRINGRWLIVTISRDITERKRAEQVRALEHEVTRRLADAADATAGLDEVIRVIAAAGEWDYGAYWNLEADGSTLRFGGGWHADDPALREFQAHARDAAFARGVGLVGTVWASGETLWVPDVMQDARALRRETLHAVGLRGAALFPVTLDGRLVGVLDLMCRAVRPRQSEFIQTMRVIGSQIGQFLHRKHAEEALRASEARFRALTKLSSDWYWEQDADFRFTRFGRHNAADDQATHGGMIGLHPWETGTAEGGWEAHRRALEAHEPFRDLVIHRTAPDGETRYFAASGEPTFDGSGRFTGYRGVARDITEAKRAEDRIQYLATHDALTGLPNRLMFNQLLGVALESAKRYGRCFAVLFIDLDRFKVINDTLGHEAGDRLLQETAVRLKQVLRASDVVARLGGDEFVVLLHEVQDAPQAAAAARKILSAIAKTLVLAGQECRVTASIGIALYTGEPEDEQSLMKNADIAMYLAKEEGKNTYRFYSRNLKTQSLERLALETSLRHALEREELSLHYQPRVDLKRGVITGAEALLRWRHPDLGMVAPAQFIPLAEETGLIVPIGRWVLNTACQQAAAWEREGLPPVGVAVNLSARQFVDENLLADVEDALRRSGLPPSRLELEITEGMVMQHPERAAALLHAIKRIGVRVAMDDFGTGYSSFGQIKRFPIDTLKVDRSFIREIPHDAEDKAITEAIIAMAKTLNLTVVAEGVETEAQTAFLRAHDCDEVQGYYFSRPIPPEEFAALLSENEPARRSNANANAAAG